MNVRFEDTLEPVGILGGLFIIVMALINLIGMPWTTSLNNIVGTIQVVGIVVMLVVGLALVWLSYTGDALPGTGAETTAGTSTESGVETNDTTAADSEVSEADDGSEESEADDEFGVTLDQAEDE